SRAVAALVSKLPACRDGSGRLEPSTLSGSRAIKITPETMPAAASPRAVQAKPIERWRVLRGPVATAAAIRAAPGPPSGARQLVRRAYSSARAKKPEPGLVSLAAVTADALRRAAA